jgi:hypothetical protein
VQRLAIKITLCISGVLTFGFAPVSSSIQEPPLGQWLAQDTCVTPTVVSPTVVSPTVVSPTVVSPTVVSPTVVSPTVVSPTVVSPTIVSTCGAPGAQPNGEGVSTPAPSPATD